MISRVVLLLAFFALGASAEPPKKSRWKATAGVHGSKVVTLSDLGEAQGGSVLNGKIYLYGDLSKATPRVGIIREYDENLVPTGRSVTLSQGGKPLLTHPTGLTQHPTFGTLLGDTFEQKGRIVSLDWEAAWRDGNLDHAVKAIVQDDAAVNGTRPLFVEVGGRTLVATADYGNKTPSLRLYDPELMLKFGKTTAKGVLVAKMPFAPFTQNLAWSPQKGILTGVQNVIAGVGWKLEAIDLAKAVRTRSLKAKGVRVGTQIFPPHDELEGYFVHPDGREIFITSSPADNVVIGKSVPIDPRWSEEMEMRPSFVEDPASRDPFCELSLHRVKGSKP